MESKKVENVVIVNDFNYTQGGASKVAIDTARLLSESGLKVYFFSAVNKEEENIQGVTYISTNQNEALKEKNKIKGAINGIYNFKAKRELKRLLKTLNSDNTIIHVHGWTKALSSSVFDIAFKMKFKVVLTLHDYFTACPNGGYFNYKQNEICYLKPLSWKCIKCNCDSRSYLFKLYRLIRQKKYNSSLKKIENVIAISDFSLKILEKSLSSNINIIRINNPIKYSQNEKIIDVSQNKYYLYVGRVSKEKGVDLFCEALTDLELPGIVVGNGDQREMLMKQYPNIKFVGWKNSDEVKEYMKNAKCLIMPSRWYEGAPLTNLEALEVGLPALVSEKCAASDVSNLKYNTGDTFSLNLLDLKNKIKNLNIKINQSNIRNVLNMYNEANYTYEIIKRFNEILRR